MGKEKFDKAYWRGIQARWLARKLKEDPDFSRRKKLKERYGITLEEYNAKLEAQGGVCAICGGLSAPMRNRNGVVVETSLAQDHCHDTGVLRGLLCRPCNQALGQFREDPDILQSARDYLLEYRDIRK